MENKNLANAYLEKAAERLVIDGFKITKEVRCKDFSFNLVARRKKFEFEKGGLAVVFYCFNSFLSPNLDTLKLFFKHSFKFSLQNGGPRPPRGIFCSVWCFPVAIVNSLEAHDAEIIRAHAPPKHWSSSEMPVVFDLGKKTLYYCQITPQWGSIYYDQMRNDIERLLAP